MSAPQEYDDAIEALRRGINALPRHSFLIDQNGGVRRVDDPSGRWIEWQAVHELCDPVMVDALLAKLTATRVIAKASTGPEHISSGDCWCHPELDYKDPETGAEVWVHKRPT